MICYLYIIENIVNHKRYVGQTTNIKKRIYEHFRRLRNNKHINKKLQNAFNKYGEESFIFTYKEVEVKDLDELDELEIDLIKKLDSYNNGYNLTLGGEGGLMPDKWLLSFDDFCIIYFGGNNWKGFSSKIISKYFDCSRSFIDSIRRGEQYPLYLQQTKDLKKEDIERYIKKFQEIFNIKDSDNFISIKRDIMTDEERIISLCLLKFIPNCKGELMERFSCSGQVFERLKRGETYSKIYDAFSQMSENAQEEIAKKYEIEWNIGEQHKRCKKIKKEDLFLCYAAYEKGKAVREIANYYHLNYSTVKNWLNGTNRKKDYEEYKRLSIEEKQKIFSKIWP